MLNGTVVRVACYKAINAGGMVLHKLLKNAWDVQ
jgi:hypothetical protein